MPRSFTPISAALLLCAPALPGCGLLLDYGPPSDGGLDARGEDAGIDAPSSLDVPEVPDVPEGRDASRPDAPMGRDAPVVDAPPTRPDAFGADVPVDAPRLLPTGTRDCTSDAMCAGGVCWDYNEIDRMCFGTVCSLSCGEDSECIAAASAAGAATPGSARCGLLDRSCDFALTGLLSIVCS